MLALEPAPFNAAKTYAQSHLTIQQTLLSESLRDLKQQQELYERTVLATVELENAELRVKRDKASVEIAKAELAEANYELAYSRLIAPFDALILSVAVNPGQSINNALQSKTLVTLVRQNHYQAKFYVPFETLGKLKIGQKVKVNVAANVYQGIISSISYESLQKPNDKVTNYLIEAIFTSPDQLLPAGHSASVHID